MASSQAKPLPSRLVPASVMRMMAPRKFAPRVAGGGDRKDEDVSVVEPNAPAQMAMVPTEFSINVVVTPEKRLGVDVDWADGKTMFIKAVQPGAVAEWNSNNPSRAVKVGDRIVAVNGRSGKAEDMVDECKSKQNLLLLIQTHIKIPVTQSNSAREEAPAKKPRVVCDSLYAGMPAPDPEKDKTAESRAKETDIFSAAPAAENAHFVVFLDIDGVLRRLDGDLTISIDGETLPLHLHNRAFAPEAVRALKSIVHRTGATIILSSEWRRNAALREEVGTALRAVGMPSIRGCTPVLVAREEVLVGTLAHPEKEATLVLRWAERRAREITMWLREHPDVDRWVALDDIDLAQADDFRLPDTCWMGPGLVRTNPSVGLSMSNARKAVEVLQAE